MSDVVEAVRERDVARTAVRARDAARERHEKAVQEANAARDALGALEAALASEIEDGDPDGKVPTLTAEIRAARTALADAESVAEAAENAVHGAVRAEARALLEAMEAEWSGRPVEVVATRVRSGLSDLAAALSELDALEADRSRMLSWSSHLIGRVLDGKGVAPALDLPAALPSMKMAAIRRAVDAARSDLPPSDGATDD